MRSLADGRGVDRGLELLVSRLELRYRYSSSSLVGWELHGGMEMR